MDAVLSGLREVDGVLGSFVLDGDGALIARDLPPLFDGDTLARASVHLSRLRAAFESDGSSFESCIARFGPHMVLLRAMGELTLCALLPHGTNLAAVQMSATLIARRLSAPARSASRPDPTPTRTVSSSAPTQSDGASRLFRGRRV